MEAILREEVGKKLTVFLVGLGKQEVTVLAVESGVALLQLSDSKKVTAATSAIVVAGPPFHS